MRLFRKKSSKDESARIAEFWGWFSQADLLDLEGEQLIKTLSPRLRKIKDSLVIETGPPDQRPRELIFSADGLTENVDSVEMLVDAAPARKEWKFIRFRPPLPGYADIGLRFGGEERRARDLKFMAYAVDDESSIDLAIFADWYTEPGPPDGALFLLLDMALGEYDVMCGIHEIRVYPLNDAPEEAHPWDVLHTLFKGDSPS